MLYRRLERVQSLLKCTRQVERAKPDRKQAVRAACPPASLLCAQLLSRASSAHTTCTHMQAEAARLEADRALNRASDIAKEEVSGSHRKLTSPHRNMILPPPQLKLFKSQRTHEMHSCLVDYTEAQLEHSRQSLEALVALKERLLSENSDSY